MPGQHSTLIGGSTASRVINCPPSIQAVADLPAVLQDKPTVYATEGTALHDIMATWILTGDLPAIGDVITVRGEGDVVFTQELMHDCIEPAMAYINQLLDEMGEGSSTMVEQRVRFPGIKDAFGTLDVLIASPRLKKTKLVDFKFGAGVGVSALYEDPDDPDMMVINEQLLYYGAAARETLPKLFPKGGTIDISICQPRHPDPTQRISTAPDITPAELAEFVARVYNAIELHSRGSEHRRRGPWCRFAPCKTTCPLWLDPLHGVALEAPKRPAASQMAPTYVAAILDAAPGIEQLIQAAREQAHALLTADIGVPGYKLVDKRATRKWLFDDQEILKRLRRQKIFKADALAPGPLKSPAQIEKLRKGVDLAGLAAPMSSGTTVAPEADHRPTALTIDKLLSQAEGSDLFAADPQGNSKPQIASSQ